MKIRQEADGSITVMCGEQEINILADSFTPARTSASGARESFGESGEPARPVIIEPPPPGPARPPATEPELPEAPIKTKPTHVAYRVAIFASGAPLIRGAIVGARAGETREHDVGELLQKGLLAPNGSVSYLFIGARSASPAGMSAELQAAIARANVRLVP